MVGTAPSRTFAHPTDSQCLLDRAGGYPTSFYQSRAREIRTI